MEAWLQTHAAFMAPLISAARLSNRTRGLSWGDARSVVGAMDSGFRAVRHRGTQLLPWNMALLARVPTAMKTLALWGAFSFGRVRSSFEGEHAVARPKPCSKISRRWLRREERLP